MAVSIRDARLFYRTLSGNGSVLAFCEAVFLAISIREAMLVYRTLSGNASVLAFCEAVFRRSAFATRCWFTAFSVVMGCFLAVNIRDAMLSVYRTRDKTATFSMVMVILGFLWRCCVGPVRGRPNNSRRECAVLATAWARSSGSNQV